MNHNLKAALARCTDPKDGRSIAAAPFSAAVDGRAVRIATDAKKILVVDAPDSVSEGNPFPSALDLIRKCNHPPTHRVSRDALIAWAGQDYRRWCGKCDGGLIGRRECQECDDGWVECDLGHEHKCAHCDGEGFIGNSCDACSGTGRLNNAIVPISIQDLAIALDAHLIGGLFDLLPGDEIGIAAGVSTSLPEWEAISFRGDGWLLIVAPLIGVAVPLRELICTTEEQS